MGDLTTKVLTRVAIFAGLGLAAWWIIRRSQLKLADVGTQVSSSLIDVFHKPGGTVNVASQHASEYDAAVQAIITANPQYTPTHVKRLLVYFNWKLGDPIPAASGLRKPAGF